MLNIYNTLNMIDEHINNAYNSIANKNVNIIDNRTCENLAKNINYISNNFLVYDNYLMMNNTLNNYNNNDLGLIYQDKINYLTGLYQYENSNWNNMNFSTFNATNIDVLENMYFINSLGQVDSGVLGRYAVLSTVEARNKKSFFENKQITFSNSINNLSYQCANQQWISLPHMQLNTANITNTMDISYMFANMNQLSNFFFEWKWNLPVRENIVNAQNMFLNCSNLSSDSINNFLYPNARDYYDDNFEPVGILPSSSYINLTSNNLNYFGFNMEDPVWHYVNRQALVMLTNKGWECPNFTLFRLNYTTVEDSVNVNYTEIKGLESNYSYNNMLWTSFTTANNLPDTNQLITLNLLEVSPRVSNINVSGVWENADLSNLVYVNFWNMENLNNVGNVFANAYNLTSFSNLYEGNQKYSNNSQYDFTGFFYNCRALQNISNMLIQNHTVIINEMFSNCRNLTDINAIKDWQLQDSMNWTFAYCDKLSSIPTLNTINVTNMEYCFSNCKNLTTIPNLNLGKVKNVGGLFSNCSNLQTIPNLNVSNVKHMYHMFQNCTNLISVPGLNFGSYYTDGITNSVESMFSNCRSLVEISNEIDFGCVNECAYMFSNCRSLISAPLINISRVWYRTEWMFANCINLIEIPDLDSRNVTQMNGMFRDCSNLSRVPTLNMDNVYEAQDMFYNCNNISSESYERITNMLPLAENLANQYLSYLGLVNTKFTPEQLTILNIKGYIDAIPPQPSSVYNIYYTLREEGN